MTDKPPSSVYAGKPKRWARTPVRYQIVVLLFFVSLINYVLRNNLSIAAPSITEEFSFSVTQLGWIIGSFNLTYALFQVPGGVFGDVFGPRRALAILCIAWGVLTALTSLATSVFAASVTGAMTALIVVRLAMGVTQAPIFPVAAGVIANWFPRGSWAAPNASLSAGLNAGQALIGPVVTILIVWLGWRGAFYALAPISVLTAYMWWTASRDRPEQHPKVLPEEVEHINAGRIASEGRSDWRKVLWNRNVLLLTASYFCSNYVFYIFAQWLFIYLVEQRGFSLLESGFMYAAPFIVGAIMSVMGGVLTDYLCSRIGPNWGLRGPAIFGLLMVACFLVAGVWAVNPFIALAFLSLCFGFTQFTEGAFWSGATHVSRAHAATATGVMNTGGNLAGILAPMIGFMIDQVGWVWTLTSGSAFAVAAAALWAFVRIDNEEHKA